MPKFPLERLPRLIWLAVFVMFVVVVIFPESNRLTRAAGLVFFLVLWFGFLGLYWRKRVLRNTLLGVTLAITVFLLLPGRTLPAREALRRDYVAGLKRYDRVTYYWGGESIKGVDCSGLIRRGLIDSLFLRGVRTLDPGLVRRALTLWWNDCTARTLGEAPAGLTDRLFDALSINQLDHTKLLPGDLAVTSNGVHIMAYLGDQTWIEADPGLGRVFSGTVPVMNNPWFDGPMKIVRWSVLAQ
jgi:hypothetical protein